MATEKVKSLHPRAPQGRRMELNTPLARYLDSMNRPIYKVAAMANIDPSTLYKYAKGTLPVTRRHKHMLCATLGVEPKVLFGE